MIMVVHTRLQVEAIMPNHNTGIIMKNKDDLINFIDENPHHFTTVELINHIEEAIIDEAIGVIHDQPNFEVNKFRLINDIREIKQ